MSVAQVGEVVANSYELVRQIGIGGAGTVWESREVQTGHPCALKILHPHLRRNEKVATRFVREARAARALTTPHAVKIESTGRMQDGTPFIVMEYLHGRPLSQLIAESGGRMSVEQVLYIVDQIATGLQDAHDHGIIHRDLKPENIFVVPLRSGPFIKIVDFGISKIFVGQDMKKVTDTGSTVGTPQYMPLEQLKGAKDLDGRVDVYALGVIMYELFSGHRPIDAFSYEQVVLQVATQAAPSLGSVRPDLSPELIQVVDACLARDVSVRMSSMDRLRTAISGLWTGDTPMFMPGTPESGQVAGGQSNAVVEVPIARPSKDPMALSGMNPLVGVGRELESASSGVDRDRTSTGGATGAEGSARSSAHGVHGADASAGYGPVPDTLLDTPRSVPGRRSGTGKRAAFLLGGVVGALGMLAFAVLVVAVLVATGVLSV